MLRRHVLSMLAGAVFASCAPAPGSLSLAPNSTLIVTRHADRLGDDLSAAGQARARALVTALAGMPLDAIHAPGIARNLDTAAPLVAARGLPVRRIPQESPAQALVASARGRTVIWIGNKGNITRIWEDLDMAGPAPLAYGDLAMLRADATGAVAVEMRRYGLE